MNRNEINYEKLEFFKQPNWNKSNWRQNEWEKSPTNVVNDQYFHNRDRDSFKSYFFFSLDSNYQFFILQHLIRANRWLIYFFVLHFFANAMFQIRCYVSSVRAASLFITFSRFHEITTYRLNRSDDGKQKHFWLKNFIKHYALDDRVSKIFF